MGNLPFSRTDTVGDGDPVPSGLLDELQDRDIAVNGLRPLVIGGAAFCDDSFAGGTAVRVGTAWTLTAGAGGGSVVASLLLPVGVSIHDVQVSAKVLVGETITSRLHRRSVGDGGATQGNVLNITANPATGAWTLSASMLGSFTPIELADGFMYELVISATSGDTVEFDAVRLIIADG